MMRNLAPGDLVKKAWDLCNQDWPGCSIMNMMHWKVIVFWGGHIVLQRFVHVRCHFQPLPTKLVFAYFDRGSYENNIIPGIPTCLQHIESQFSTIGYTPQHRTMSYLQSNKHVTQGSKSNKPMEKIQEEIIQTCFFSLTSVPMLSFWWVFFPTGHPSSIFSATAFCVICILVEALNLTLHLLPFSWSQHVNAKEPTSLLPTQSLAKKLKELKLALQIIDFLCQRWEGHGRHVLSGAHTAKAKSFYHWWHEISKIIRVRGYQVPISMTLCSGHWSSIRICRECKINP